MVTIRFTPASAKRACLVCCMALMILAMGSCLAPPVEQATRTQPGELSSGIEFLKKASPDHIRVMSYNVGWDSIFPDDDPQSVTHQSELQVV